MQLCLDTFSTVKYLVIEQLCDPFVKDVDCDTPFHVAAANGHLELVMFFVESLDCDPNAPGELGKTLLHYAGEEGHLSIVHYLVQVKIANVIH